MSSAIPQNELARLKERVLRAVLTNQPLPGSDHPLNFPDRAFVLNEPAIYLLDNDIKTDVKVEGLDGPVQLISNETLAKQQEASGKVVFLQFRTSHISENSLNLRLDVKVQSAGGRQSSLTSMEMKFARLGDEWQMMDEPTSLSA